MGLLRGALFFGAYVATHSITDDILNSLAAERYFTQADSRIMIGLRATVEMLGLPTPEYARRRKPGPTPAKSVAQAFMADNPKAHSTMLQPRRKNAPADRVTVAREANRAALSGASDE